MKAMPNSPAAVNALHRHVLFRWQPDLAGKLEQMGAGRDQRQRATSRQANCNASKNLKLPI
jgi:hypothetical protein